MSSHTLHVYQVIPPARCSNCYSQSSSSLPCSIARGLFSTGTGPVRLSRLRPKLRPCVFLPRVLYRFAASPPNCRHAKNTRHEPKGARGGCRGVHRGARRAEIAPPSLIEARNRRSRNTSPWPWPPNWLRLGSPHMSDERGNLVVPPL